MMRLVTLAPAEELDLPGADLRLEISNPYFSTDSIPGTITQSLDLPWTRPNLRGLGFPDRYRGPGGPAPVPADCYLDGARWRRGKLVFRECDVPAQRLRYHFVADAADLATQLRDVKLADLSLGTVPFSRVPSTADYALLPVRNRLFFGDNEEEIPAGYPGVLNYFTAGVYPSEAQLAPQLYLMPLLRRVMAHFGYTIEGAWVDDAEIQQLVIYSDRVVGLGTLELELAQHVPDMSVPDLLIALQQAFCLGLYFDTTRQVLRLTPLRDVLAAAGSQYQQRAGRRQTTVANDTNGFELQLRPEGDDELDKTLDRSWQQARFGAGGERIEVSAGTLHLVYASDEQHVGRSWLLPAIEAAGAVAGEASKAGLRLLFDRGLQADNLGGMYPLGSPATRSYAGDVVGQYSLLAGDLVADWHAAWLTFRSRSVQHTYEAEFRLPDLLALDPGRAELLDHHLHLWEKVSLTISATSSLQRASITYRELL